MQGNQWFSIGCLRRRHSPTRVQHHLEHAKVTVTFGYPLFCVLPCSFTLCFLKIPGILILPGISTPWFTQYSGLPGISYPMVLPYILVYPVFLPHDFTPCYFTLYLFPAKSGYPVFLRHLFLGGIIWGSCPLLFYTALFFPVLFTWYHFTWYSTRYYFMG